jgi:hypothetical protein
MVKSQLTAQIREKFSRLQSVFNERSRRLWAASEAISLGHGGVQCVSCATGLARSTIYRGINEIEQNEARDPTKDSHIRIRRPGGGRKSVTTSHPDIERKLESLIEPVRGDPMSPLRWTCKSTRRLAKELTDQGIPVCARKVAALLQSLDYSLQANRKTREGINHPDRNKQFEYIYQMINRFHRGKQPVISVDTKKKELVGDFSNGGKEYRKKGHPIQTRTHDFVDKDLGKAIPYGVYDIKSNEGWVSVGINHDTSRFAANSILKWWQKMGHRRYPKASRLFITADAGGSNGWRTRLWKIALQEIANVMDLNITVSHFPPGTSKWNKIEHRLFSFISQNWRGKPLYDLKTIVNSIAATTTSAGLVVKSAIDKKYYEKGIKVSDEDLAKVRLKRHDFHGEWNYTIRKVSRVKV